jgi:hypothetical protein
MSSYGVKKKNDCHTETSCISPFGSLFSSRS